MYFFSIINQLFTVLILTLFSFIAPFIHLPATGFRFPESRFIATPSAQLTASLTAIPSKITVDAPPVQTRAIQTSQPVPWGTTEKIGDHLYRTYVADDPAMGTPSEILTALNSYRHSHNQGTLNSDDGLCRLAQTRASTQNAMGTLDEHKGLIDYMANDKRWEELNITAIGENASYGYTLSGVHLIEWVFDSDVEHRTNQLNPDWNLACAGTNGVTVDIIFGKR